MISSFHGSAFIALLYSIRSLRATSTEKKRTLLRSTRPPPAHGLLAHRRPRNRGGSSTSVLRRSARNRPQNRISFETVASPASSPPTRLHNFRWAGCSRTSGIRAPMPTPNCLQIYKNRRNLILRYWEIQFNLCKKFPNRPKIANNVIAKKRRADSRRSNMNGAFIRRMTALALCTSQG